MVNTVKSAANLGRQALNWVGTQVNNARDWVTQQWNNYQSRTSYHAAPAGGYGGYGGGTSQVSSSHVYVQQQQAQQRAQVEQRRQQAIRDEYTQATGMKGTPKSREGKNLLRNWGASLAKTLKHVCTTAEKIEKQDKKAKNKIDWEKVVPVIKYGAAFASGFVSGLDKIGQGLDVSRGLGGILRSINPIAKMGGKTGFIMPNTSSIFYKAGTLMNKIGQKAAPVAKILTSKTFQAVGFAVGVADDIANQGKTFGQAVAHNAGGVLAGIGGGLLVTGGAAALGFSAPLVLVAGGAFLAAWGYEELYQRNKGFQAVDAVGDVIDNIKHHDGSTPIPPLKKEPFIPLPPNY